MIHTLSDELAFKFEVRQGMKDYNICTHKKYEASIFFVLPDFWPPVVPRRVCMSFFVRLVSCGAVVWRSVWEAVQSIV
jgi:hypothetical protein